MRYEFIEPFSCNWTSLVHSGYPPSNFVLGHISTLNFNLSDWCSRMSIYSGKYRHFLVSTGSLYYGMVSIDLRERTLLESTGNYSVRVDLIVPDIMFIMWFSWTSTYSYNARFTHCTHYTCTQHSVTPSDTQWLCTPKLVLKYRVRPAIVN